MNIATLNNSTGALRSVSEDVEKHSDRLHSIWERDVTMRDADLAEARKVLAEIDEIIPGLSRYAARLASIARPAEPREISEHLIAIRLNFHNSKATGEGYARIMIERVEAQMPSFAALEWATREIIDRRKFMPVTAEVLEEMATAQRRFERLRDIVDTLPARRDKLVRRISAGG